LAAAPTLRFKQEKITFVASEHDQFAVFASIQGDPSLLAGLPQLARVALYGGGFPIKVDGAIVGAIGVSGGTVQNDVDCAQAALCVVK
jgi:uncharacterized protein GlcG (DUF336 family)